MKKLLTIVLALVLVFLFTVTSFADITQDSEQQNGTVNVTYEVGSSYTVTIPADVTFTSSSLSKSEALSASNVLIPSGKTLKVNIASANDYKLKNANDATGSIAYTVTGSTTITSGLALSVSAGTASGSNTLTFATTADNIKGAKIAGAYTDTLTFTVSVE